jgi:esterase/lipase
MRKTTVKENGFEGILLPGDGSHEKVMIVMSGSNGGMRMTKQIADFYHEHGIPALALALFGTKGTQPFLDRVPVEYVEHAIQWLKAQGYQKIGIDGISKGSEMALVAASMFPEISCVIARVPSYFVSEGLKGNGMRKTTSGTSCWSYQGKELPYAPYCGNEKSINMMKIILTEKEMHIITINRDKRITPDSIIPIERIRGSVLLLSSKHDVVWPSYDSAVYMENKLKESGFPYAHRHVAFDHMSHVMVTDMPPVFKLAFKAEREDPEGCAGDREQLKKEILDWVGQWGGEKHT